MSQIIYIHFQNGFEEYVLSGMNDRTLPVRLSKAISGCSDDVFLSLEVWDRQWYITQNTEISFQGDNNANEKLMLEHNVAVSCVLKKSGTVFIVIFQDIAEDYLQFTKYELSGTVSIGKNSGSTVVYSHKYVSFTHAVIERNRDGGAILRDNSTNGTFLNGKRILQAAELKFGDIIYILGLKIIFLDQYVAINQIQELEAVNLRAVRLESPAEEDLSSETKEASEDILYSRAPRKILQLDKELVEIEAPPQKNRQRKQPLIFTIGPAVTMVVPMALGIGFAAIASSTAGGTTSPLMYMGIITAVAAAVLGVGWGLANYKYSRSMEQKEEELRCVQYSRYLERITKLIKTKHEENRNMLEQMYPESAACLQWANGMNQRLWERNINHTDFLTVRLGRGSIPAFNNIMIPKERFSLFNDALAEEPANIKKSFEKLADVPVCMSLLNQNLVGIIGKNRQDVLNIGRIISLQIAAHHYYSDVRMVFVYNREEEREWLYARWLPHCFTPDGAMRMVVDDPVSAGEVFYSIADVLREREEQSNDRHDDSRILPHYVFFVASPELVENEAILRYIADPKSGSGVTTILLYDEIGRLPNNCTIIVQADQSYNGYFSVDDAFRYSDIAFDRVTEAQTEQFAREISGKHVREFQTGGMVPQMLSFFDMYKTNKVADLDVWHRWLENRTYESMRAVIGHKAGGVPMYMDINEKYHGPHGLVAGTTGSGKSEMLQTYILSLAANYHPHEVSFILIDYKGGGMAVCFKDLPHVAGIITNLGGNQTVRALASINSEIKRRQTIFLEHEVKHIDMYIEYYRAGKVKIPIPHLLIIADEFAELKKEQPDFVRELVSASRVGRSLGVHLILATQKPSGVVDDQIWSNSKFKICLRVQDRSDSIEMLRRPEAAYITNPGRGFFQVGNGEIFEEFQSGWSGAEYKPDARYTDASKSDVRMINIWGKPCAVGSVKKGTQVPSKDKVKKVTQLDAAVQHIVEVARDRGISALGNIWMPPLKSTIYLDEIESFRVGAYDGNWKREKPFELRAIIGIVDDPVNQSQGALFVDLIANGNYLISGSASGGKTTHLQSLLYSLMLSYSPMRLHTYIVDFGSRTMGVFESLPHVGGVVYDDELDKLAKLFGMLHKELIWRRQKFSERGIGSFKEYVRIYQDVPAFLIAIDNYSAFIESIGKQEDGLLSLTREGASYGIFFVMTCNNSSDVRMKLRRNFPFGAGLQLADKYEYEAAIGDKAEIEAEPKTPGRGIIRYPNAIEFQTALCLKAQDAMEMNVLLRQQFEHIRSEWKGNRAKRIPQVPTDMTFGTFTAHPEIQLIDRSVLLPIGFDQDQAEPYSIDLKKCFCFAVGGHERSGKTNFIKLAMQQAKAGGARVYLFDNDQRELSEYSKRCGVDGYMTDVDDLAKFLSEVIRPEFVKRNEKKGECTNKAKLFELMADSADKLFVFIHDMESFMRAVYTSERELNPFVETMFAKGAEHLIYFIGGVASSGYANYSARTAMRTFSNWKTGIHFGGYTDNQRLFEFMLPQADRSRRQAPGIGFVNEPDRTVRVITAELS